jgi:putative DNA primase/helicase
MTVCSDSTHLCSDALLIQALDHERIWVAWQVEADRYTGKQHKVPYNPNHIWQWAKADDPSTWGTRRTAQARARLLRMPFGLGGIGVQFGPLSDGTWLGGADFASCRDKVTGGIDAWAQAILRALDSYSEISPSGTSIKTFFRVEAADVPTVQEAFGKTTTGELKYGTTFKRTTGAEHPPGIEIYIARRYFTLTDQTLTDSNLELRLVPLAVLLELLEITGPAFMTDGLVLPKSETSLPRPASLGGYGAADNSASAIALRLAVKRVAAGANETQVWAALAGDPGTAEWLRTKGDANGGREFNQTYALAVARIESQLAENEFSAFEPAP